VILKRRNKTKNKWYLSILEIQNKMGNECEGNWIGILLMDLEAPSFQPFTKMVNAVLRVGQMGKRPVFTHVGGEDNHRT